MLFCPHLFLDHVQMLKDPLSVFLAHSCPEPNQQLVVREHIVNNGLITKKEVELIPLYLAKIVLVLHIDRFLKDSAKALTESKGSDITTFMFTHECVIDLWKLLWPFWSLLLRILICAYPIVERVLTDPCLVLLLLLGD